MIAMCYRIAGGDFDTAGLATRQLKEQLAKIGVDSEVLRRIMIAAYEAEMNVVIHARTGNLWARLDGERLDLEIADEGPGIPNIELAMREGWSTASEQARQMGFGAGLGLPNIKRNSDLFEIESRVGKGTRVRSTIYLRPVEASGTAQRAKISDSDLTTLSIDGERCRSCLRCLFTCPTGALRAREGGPRLLPHLCIGCTACIAECPDKVFGIREENAPADLREIAEDSILIAPAGFFSGFPGNVGPSRVVAALKGLGFREVWQTEEWEKALRCESRRHAAGAHARRPLITPVCPAAVALIETQYPSLIPCLMPSLSPVEAAGEEFPLEPVVLAAACPSQYAAASRTSVTGRFTVVAPARLASAVLSMIGGEASGQKQASMGNGAAAQFVLPDADSRPGELRVTGLRHVLRALSEVEIGGLEDVAVLELFACEQGCTGSPLLGVDPFIRARSAPFPIEAVKASAVARARPFSPRPGIRLDEDMARAIAKLSRIDALTRGFPGRDCGVCGAPSCAALAEDIVMGRAGGAACPYTKPSARDEKLGTEAAK